MNKLLASVVIVPVSDVFITIGYLRFTKVSLAKLLRLD